MSRLRKLLINSFFDSSALKISLKGSSTWLLNCVKPSLRYDLFNLRFDGLIISRLKGLTG